MLKAIRGCLPRVAVVAKGFGWEVFVEPSSAAQRGVWIDREPGRWFRVGLGSSVLCAARLP